LNVTCRLLNGAVCAEADAAHTTITAVARIRHRHHPKEVTLLSRVGLNATPLIDR
jgi:hypothetical protein